MKGEGQDIAYTPKMGDIKVDSEDLMNLMEGIEYLQHIVSRNLNVLDDEELKTVQSHQDAYYAFLSKYIVVSHLRRKEHLWFLILKKIDNKDYAAVEKDEIQSEGDEGISFYMDILDGMIQDVQELPSIDTLLGFMVTNFGADDVRREVWGTYLETKDQRERMIREIKSKCN